MSFSLTWLRPGYPGSGFVAVALALMTVALVVGSFAARRRPPDGQVVVGAAVVAILAATTAVFADATNVVPGLLVAFPLLVAGLVAIRCETGRSPAARLALVTFCLFALAVIATQYELGGSGEWGGRYFAIGLPIVVPVALLALRDAGRRLQPGARRAGAGALVVCSLAMALMAITSLRENHRSISEVISGVDGAVGASGLERPVLITTTGLLPRKAWSTFDRQRWLLTDRSGLADLVRRVSAAGERQAILVSVHWRQDVGALGPDVRVVTRTGVSGDSRWQVVVLRTGP